MAQISITKCDQCGKRTDDHYTERGWIQIQGTVTRAYGRDNRGQAVTEFFD